MEDNTINQPNSETVRLMREFITRLRMQNAAMADLNPQPTIEEMVRNLQAVFIPYLGEERVISSFAIPLDYLAFLMVAENGWTDDDRWTVLYSRADVLGNTRSDIESNGEPPQPNLVVHGVVSYTDDGQRVVSYYEEDVGAKVPLDQRELWLSIGMNSARGKTYLCCDRRSHKYGWVGVWTDSHPWYADHPYRSWRDEDHGSFLSYLRKHRCIRDDKVLRRLIGQMRANIRADNHPH